MANDVGRNGHSRQEIDPSTYPEEFVLQLNTEDFPMELAGRLLQYLSMQTFNAGDGEPLSRSCTRVSTTAANFYFYLGGFA